MIQRVFALLLLAHIALVASHYNSTLMELEAKLFVKMALLSEDINKSKETLDITIVTQGCDTHYAYEFKNLIEKNYTEKIMQKSVVVKIEEFTTLSYDADLLILLHSKEELLRKICKTANNKKILTFSYEPSYLIYGVLGSLYIGVSTKPLLNKDVIREYGFTFNPYLLELSKFY